LMIKGIFCRNSSLLRLITKSVLSILKEKAPGFAKNYPERP